MYKLLLLSTVNLATVGLWVNSDGSKHELPCPTEYVSDSGSIKLPKGCMAPVQGFLLSMEDYSKLRGLSRALKADRDSCREVDVPSRDNRISTLEKSNEASSQVIKNLEGSLAVCNSLHSQALENETNTTRNNFFIGFTSFALGASTTAFTLWLVK